MPFVFDLKNSIGEIHTMEVFPEGWKSPVTIEYCVAQAHSYDPTLSVVWRVKGTEHCFTIGEHRLNTISNGDYKQHFKKVLEGFRKDYLSWFTEEEYRNCDWRNEYARQFSRFILPDTDKDNTSKGKEN